MCTRPSDKTPFWVNPCGPDVEPTGPPPKEMNATSVRIAANAAMSAMDSAEQLKEQFKKQMISKGSDPDTIKNSFDWLPRLPKTFRGQEFQQHLQSLEWQETLLDLYKHLQTIAVPLEQLIIDFNEIEPPKVNVSQMEGLVGNVLCELHDSIADNNLRIKGNVGREVMGNAQRALCNDKTNRVIRDWIVLRELVNVLDYTAKVCEYLVNGKK